MTLHIDFDRERRQAAERHPRKLKLRGPLPAVPAGVKLPALAKGLDELLRLRQQGREAAQADLDAQAELVRAEVADRNAYATAIRAGKADPGTPAADAARARIADAGRRRAAIGQARLSVEREVAALIEREQSAFLEVVDAEVKVATEAATAALAVLEAARARLAELEAFAAWMTARKVPADRTADALRGLRRDLARREDATEDDASDG